MRSVFGKKVDNWGWGEVGLGFLLGCFLNWCVNENLFVFGIEISKLILNDF